MTKFNLHEKALELRKQGFSYTYIQKEINVSKSTLSEWLSGIGYIPNKETTDKIKKAREMAVVAQKEKKRKSIENAKEVALKDISKFSKRDLFMLGIGIYIGEGSKTANVIRFVNSDPKIIKTMIMWFKKICDLQNENFSIRIHLYPDNDENEVINFWSKETGFSRNLFLKTVVDSRTDKKRKNFGKLPYGTAHVTVKSVNGKAGVALLRRMFSWIDIVHEKTAGIV